MKQVSPHPPATAAFRKAVKALTRSLDGVLADLAGCDRAADLAQLSLPLTDVDPFGMAPPADNTAAAEEDLPGRSRAGRAPSLSSQTVSPTAVSGRRAPGVAGGSYPEAVPPAVSVREGPVPVASRPEQARAIPVARSPARGGIPVPVGFAAAAADVTTAPVGTGSAGTAGGPVAEAGSAARQDRAVALLDALARAFGEPAGSLVPSYAAAPEGSGRNSGEAAMGTALPAPLPGQDSPPGVKNPYQRAAAARDAGASHGPNPMATGDRQTGEPTLAAVAGSAFPAAQPRVAAATGLAGVAGTLAHYTGRLFKSTAGPRSDLPVRGERPSPAVISHRRGDRPAAATERTPSGSVPLASKRQQLAPLPAERVSSRPARALSSPDPWEASGAKASHHRETPVETWDESRRLADLINDVLVEQARLDGVDLS